MKRILLYLGTNFAILLLLGIVLSLLGVSAQSTTGLLVIALVFGFGGSMISLAISKWVAKRFTGARVIQSPANAQEKWLVDTVARLASKAGIGMPEVAIYPAPEINAFATGARRDNALVAVSTGLLAGMQADEVEAVLAHEVAHIANGDMVTMALLQGVLNTFVILLARVVGRVIDGYLGNRDGAPGLGYYASVFALEIVFGLFASMIAMWFSRQREFRADSGSASLVGRDKMIRALEAIGRSYGENTLPKQIAAFGISGMVPAGFKRLFASHPPLAERIQALRSHVS